MTPDDASWRLMRRLIDGGPERRLAENRGQGCLNGLPRGEERKELSESRRGGVRQRRRDTGIRAAECGSRGCNVMAVAGWPPRAHGGYVASVARRPGRVRSRAPRRPRPRSPRGLACEFSELTSDAGVWCESNDECLYRYLMSRLDGVLCNYRPYNALNAQHLHQGARGRNTHDTSLRRRITHAYSPVGLLR